MKSDYSKIEKAIANNARLLQQLEEINITHLAKLRAAANLISIELKKIEDEVKN